MIRKLRIRLVLAAMASLIVVLTVIIGMAGILNYHNIVAEANDKLLVMSENDGMIPENLDMIGMRRDGHMRSFSPEMAFESRYFSVDLTAECTVQNVNTGRITAVDTAQAIRYADEIVQAGKEEGFLDTYRYLLTTDDSDCIHIYFIDCFRELQSFRRFLLYSILMSVLGSLAVLILLIALSQRIVKPIAESYEKQKRFITDAGHELKTPLAIINADAEVLEMDYGESEWLDDIRSQTERLTDLTNNLVFLARMEEQPQVEMIEFSLSEAAQEASDEYQAVAVSRGKNLSSQIEPNLTMRGDEKMIRRLMAIFLDNAMKYTNENGEIQLSLDRNRGQLRLQVYNTTEHIDRDAIEHLFDRFYRTDRSRNSQTGGYGLGLSIAAAIVSTHNGRILASTEDERSLRILVTFPI